MRHGPCQRIKQSQRLESGGMFKRLKTAAELIKGLMVSASWTNVSAKSNTPFSARCPVSQGGWCRNRWGRRRSLGRREASHCRSTETLKQKGKAEKWKQQSHDIQIQFGWSFRQLGRDTQPPAISALNWKLDHLCHKAELAQFSSSSLRRQEGLFNGEA